MIEEDLPMEQLERFFLNIAREDNNNNNNSQNHNNTKLKNL